MNQWCQRKRTYPATLISIIFESHIYSWAVIPLTLLFAFSSPTRADIILTSTPNLFLQFDQGWSFDGGTVSLIDGFSGTIDSTNVDSVITSFDYSFTSPNATYHLTSASSTISISGLGLEFDGTTLLLPQSSTNTDTRVSIEDQAKLREMVWFSQRTPAVAGRPRMALVDLTLSFPDSPVSARNFPSSQNNLRFAAIPEPATWTILAIGLAPFAFKRRKPTGTKQWYEPKSVLRSF